MTGKQTSPTESHGSAGWGLRQVLPHMGGPGLLENRRLLPTIGFSGHAKSLTVARATWLFAITTGDVTVQPPPSPLYLPN